MHISSHERLLSFPAFFPGETVPSVVGRYFFEYGHFDTSAATVRFFFGISSKYLTSTVPRGLARFVSLLPESLMLDHPAILSKHTLFPLVKLFLPSFRTREVRRKLLSGQDQIVRSLGLDPRGRNNSAPPKMCWRCFEDDVREFGQAYWHRAHQIPGVHVCDRHGMVLLDGCSRCAPFKRSKYRLSLPHLYCECGHDLREDEAVEHGRCGGIEAAIKCATFARHLLEADLPDKFGDRRLSFMHVELERVGWAWCKEARYEALISKIISKVSPRLLDDLELPDTPRDNVDELVRKWAHLLLMGYFLSEDEGWPLEFFMNVFGDVQNLKSRWDEFIQRDDTQMLD